MNRKLVVAVFTLAAAGLVAGTALRRAPRLVAVRESGEPTVNPAVPAQDGASAPARPLRAVASVAPGAAAAANPDELAREDLERLREPMAMLFAAQDDVGPGAEERYRARDRQLFSDPGASRALRARYRELPPTHRAERWRIVATLGEHLSPDNAAFLRDVAVAAAAGTAPQADAMVGRRAALGVAEAWERGESQAADLLRDVLAQASPPAVEAVMLQLTANGSVAPWQRQVVAGRGLPTVYRKLTPAEQASIERLNTGTGPKPDGRIEAPRPVPSLEQLGSSAPR